MAAPSTTLSGGEQVPGVVGGLPPPELPRRRRRWRLLIVLVGIGGFLAGSVVTAGLILAIERDREASEGQPSDAGAGGSAEPAPQLDPPDTTARGTILNAEDTEEAVDSAEPERDNAAAVEQTADTRELAQPAPLATEPFVESFSGNSGLERFDLGMAHRDDVLVATREWTGDHDLACDSPDTQRTIHRDHPEESFYVCRDHIMTSVGDTSGYSIAWFSPKQSFQRGEFTTVSWDVNVTDLGNRQWWEVVLIGEGQPFLTTIEWVANTAEIEPYHPETIAVGKGPYGNDGNIFAGGESRDPLGWSHIADTDPEGAESKAIRRTFSMTDNLDGTITFSYLGESYTYPGEFPESFRVYFKDHNYTPDKDGVPVGHTWHWDEIVVS